MEKIKLNTMIGILDSLHSLKITPPEMMYENLVRMVEQNYKDMVPAEFTRIFKIIPTERKDIKEKLEKFYKEYFFGFFDEMNDSEVCESWALIDFAKFETSADMTKLIENKIKKDANSLSLPDLVNYAHLRIKTTNALEKKEPNDDLLFETLIPRSIFMLKRMRMVKESMVVAKWLTKLPIKNEEQIENFVEVLKKLEYTDPLDYFHAKQFLKFAEEKYDKLTGQCRSAIVFLEERYQSQQLKTA